MNSHKRSILFVCNYLPEKNNSVSAILNRIVDLDCFKEHEAVFARYDKLHFEKAKRSSVNGNVVFYVEKEQDFRRALTDPDATLIDKIKTFFIRLRDKICKEQVSPYLSFFKYVYKRVDPVKVVFLTYSLDIEIAKFLATRKTKFFTFLYDTLIDRPNEDLNSNKVIEEQIIELSELYFVPSFFYPKYQQIYSNEKIVPYRLPLVIDEETVKSAFASFGNGNSTFLFDFSYFGQIQSFRNFDDIVKIFEELGISLHVFSDRQTGNKNSVIFHKTESGSNLYKMIVESNFLVFFDNSPPYQHYLPAKAYLYVSFTKPIIIFGNNTESASIDFFKNYPICYYHKIGGDIKGLVSFISKYRETKLGFLKNVYDNFRDYTSTSSLKDIGDKIKILDNNDE